MRLHYNTGALESLTDLITEFRPVIEQHGSPLQQGRFLHHVVRANYRRDRYVIREETLVASRGALAAVQASGQIHETALAQFGVGFTLLWRGSLTGAVAEMLQALKLLEQTGDAANQLMCLTYLAIAHRRLQDLQQVRQYADLSLPLATARQVHHYIGVAEANLAWLEWRAGELDIAMIRCQTALTHMGAEYPFQWTALLILVAALLDRQQIEQAVGYAHALVDPAQQLLPDPIELLLTQAIHAWEQHDSVIAQQCLAEAVRHALTLGYL
jgi:tetratricopeptide (TPR) repeat protein